MFRSIKRRPVNWELAVVGIALLFSASIHLALIDPAFNGPDAVSNIEFGQLGQDWSWWLDPTAFHSYLFPMFYGTFFALVTKVTGGSYFLIQLLQIGMALTLALYGWYLTRHISRPARLLTLIAIAFSPAMFGLARMNGYEILLGFLVASSVVLLWGRGGHPMTPSAVIRYFSLGMSGLVFGLAMLTQGKVTVLAPVLLVLAWKWGKGPFLLFVITATAPVVAWAIRNHFVISTWNPFNSSSAVVMWMGSNPHTQTGEYVLVPPLPPEGHSFYSASFDFIINQPEKAFALLLRRMVRLFEPMYVYLAPDQASLFQSALHVTFMFTAILGLIFFLFYIFGRAWVRPPQIPQVGALAAMTVIFFLVHLPFATETRHLKPIVPVALCVTVPTLVALAQRLLAKRGSFRIFQRWSNRDPKAETAPTP